MPDLNPVSRTVPNVRDKTLTQARQILEAQRLFGHNAGSTPVSEPPSGLVRIQHPAAGAVVPTGTTVNLTLGVWNGNRQ